jgi:hypothetical protein
MNLANKTFRDNKTGEIIKVIDSFENIAILENKQKMDVKRLMNTEYYTEQIDPSSFFNNQNAYNSLAEKIKSIPVDKIKDDPTSGEVQINIDGMKLPGTIAPATNESAIVMTTEEDEMAELARKYGVTNPSNDIQRQNEAFAKLLAEDEGEVQSIQVNREPLQSVTTQEVRREVPKVEDPIITMFKNVKRNKDFSITLEINNKIPRPDFIEMMEDSYNTSIIDFLASEFTQNLLSNPEVIENMIKDKIKELVYGPVETPVNPQITDSVTQINEVTGEVKIETPRPTRKPRAKKETSK